MKSARRLLVSLVFGVPAVATSAELPVPCAAGTCVSGPSVWTSDAATLSVLGNTLRIDQFDDRAIFNWASFDVSEDGRVEFVQPGVSAIALNRIYQDDPSRILGSIEANGQVYLINPNGLMFGAHSSVETNSLVASTLDVSDQIFRGAGIVRAIDQGDGLPAFEGTGPMGAIRIESGASIRTAEGGRVLIFAPEVVNAGRIETPGGQAVLGGSFDRVYLQASSDPALRGLLVEVGTGGSVANLGQVLSERGNTTFVGLAVNNAGLVSATTSVSVNGSIRLLARDGATVTQVATGRVLSASNGGSLVLDPGSRLSILPDDDSTLAVDDQPQVLSRIELLGQTIWIGNDAWVTASGGIIDVTATSQPSVAVGGVVDRKATIDIDAGALLDVSGASGTVIPMERNLLAFELRANELADAPLQRDGELRGERVFVDTRLGTPLTNVDPVRATIQRSVAERLSAGGVVNLAANGAVRVLDGATIDVGGGDVRYADGRLPATQVLSNGNIVDISTADPDAPYSAIVGRFEKQHTRWGIVESFGVAGLAGGDGFVPGYVEGKDAGALVIRANDLELDGDVLGDVTAGRYQRSETQALTSTRRYVRDFQQMPDTGRLAIDLSIAPSERIDVGIGQVVGDDIVRIGEAVFDDGIGHFSLVTNGNVEALGLDLVMPAFGSFRLEGGDLMLSGLVDVASGEIELVSRKPEGSNARLRVESALLDTSGRWTNDFYRVDDPLGALAIDGGRVSLDASGDLFVSANSAIRADAGAWYGGAGALALGRGGDALLSTELAGFDTFFDVRGSVTGYGFTEGGELSLVANGVVVLGGVPPLLPGSGGEGGGNGGVGGSPPETTLLALNASVFGGLGFQKVSVLANRSDLSVAPNVNVVAQLRNIALEDGYELAESTRSTRGLGSLTFLPDHERNPVDVTLSALQTARTVSTPSRLEIGAGSTLLLDPRGRLSLVADGALDIDGRIVAPGGEVTARLQKSSSDVDPGFRADQVLELGANAIIDVRGGLLLEPNERGLRRGETIDAGRVELAADRGYLIMREGARVDASGTAGTLDLFVDDALIPSATPVEAKAGTIALSAAEGMSLAADLRATAAPLATAEGGRLAVTLDASTRAQDEEDTTFPETDRVVRLGATTVAAEVPPDGPVPNALNGRAELDDSIVRAGGFASLTLRARNVPDRLDPSTFRAFGVVELANDSPLLLADTLTLDAPVFRVEGDVELGATYTSFGSFQPLQVTAPAPLSGTGRLSLDSRYVDLVGATTVSGAASIAIDGSEGVRLRGLQKQPDAGELLGSLTTFADVAIGSPVLFPSTLTSYTFDVRGSGDFTLSGVAAGADVRLGTAGGNVRVLAEDVSIGSRLAAPLGTLAVSARSTLSIADGGAVSTAGTEGVIYGQTQGRLDWIVPLSDIKNLILDAPPEKNVSLSAPSLVIGAGASIDLSGGGDVLAYEFVPGPGGSQDVLDNAFEPGAFAVVPVLGDAFAPYDPVESAGFEFGPTAGVYLSGIPGLPAGTYAKLPPRYSLQPGAFLVRPVAIAEDVRPGVVAIEPDGVPIIAGRDVVLGTAVTDAQWSAFRVESGAVVRQRAEYVFSTGNGFFPALAERSNDSVPRLARDGGDLLIDAGDMLDFAGQIDADPDDEGLGGRLTVTGNDVRIVRAGTAVSGVALREDQLNQVRAASVLIGGRRVEEGGADETIAVTAETIAVDEGVSLEIDELVLVARDGIDVGTGASVSTRAVEGDVTSATLRTAGDVAVLAVSNTRALALDREADVGVRGRVELGADSALSASGSLIVSGSEAVLLGGSVSASGARATLGASRVVLGGDGSDGTGLLLSQAALDGLDAQSLDLQSRSTIDVAGDVDVAAASLRLATSGLRNVAGSDVSANLTADDLTVTGGNVGVAAPAAAPAGTVRLAAERLRIEGGEIAVEGFDALMLDGAQSVVGDDVVVTSTSASEVRVRSDLVTATDGGALSILAENAAVTIEGRDPATGSAVTSARGGLGARVDIRGASLVTDTTIDVVGGVVALDARDSLEVRGGTVSAAGTSRPLGGEDVRVGGGSVSLAAQTGSIVVGAAAVVDVSGTARDSGRVALTAPASTVELDGTLVASGGGRLDVDATTLPSLDAVASAAASGFDRRIALRQRNGDVLVSDGVSLVADEIDLAADAGALMVEGTVEVGSERRSELHGANGVTLLSGSTLTSRGADVLLASAGGAVRVAGGAAVDLGDTGTLAVRVQAGAPDAVVSVDPTVALRAEAVAVELYRQTTVADGVLDASDVAALQVEVDGLAPALAGLESDLAGLAAPVRAQAGLEVVAPGDLRIEPLWDLLAWRPDGDAGLLTVRAAGTLQLDAGVSDGVIPRAPSGGTPVLSLSATDSWGLTLVSGADLASADPRRVSGDGDLVLRPGAVVRTGTGDIRLSVGGDLRMQDANAAIYSAGRSTGVGTLPASISTSLLARAEYPDGGGDLDIDVGGDLIGAPGRQLFTDWWWRIGGDAGFLGRLPTNYGVTLGTFAQGVASFGGGDVRIDAGGDVVDLAVSLPVTGQHVGDVTRVGSAFTFTDNSYIERGGGDLDVSAGGDVVGGTFWVARGEATFGSGGGFRASTTTGLGLLLGLSDASAVVSAVDGVRLDGVMNPSLLPQSDLQRSVDSVRSYFHSYGADDSVTVLTLTGDVEVANDRTRISDWVDLDFGAIAQNDRALDLYPGSVAMRALAGSIVLTGDMSLFPDRDGGLELIAHRDVRATASSVNISDADIDLLANPQAPAQTLDDLRLRIPRGNITAPEFFHARAPVHANDPSPSRIVAETGDVTASTVLQLVSAESVEVYAGRDVRDIDVRVQNVSPEDVSLLQAGRDVAFSTLRSQTSGLVLNNSNRIEVAGPGRLDVVAGRNIDLGTSEGILTTGDQSNAALADDGASVLAFAGVDELDDTAFVEEFILPSATNRKIVTDAIRAREGDETLSEAEALAIFASLSQLDRRGIVQLTFFAELQAVGEANVAEGTDFERGFEAIRTLYPDAEERVGDLSLFFSRIQTADGGDIALNVPSGLVNAGLSASFAGAKGPSELGIVAQRTGDVKGVAKDDIQVNQSRVFALDGGSILLWSSEGDIDAGRGAKSALSVPPPNVGFDENGNVVVEFPPAIAGSGIRTAVSTPDREAGDVFLFAPAGVVNAGDAGIISAGDLTIAATDVIGADNIDVGGLSLGVPVDTSGLAAGLAGVTDVSASASKSAEESAAGADGQDPADQGLADAAMGWLDVLLEGYGETGEDDEEEKKSRTRTQ
jgi:filamentous hemagglutinin family protein